MAQMLDSGSRGGRARPVKARRTFNIGQGARRTQPAARVGQSAQAAPKPAARVGQSAQRSWQPSYNTGRAAQQSWSAPSSYSNVGRSAQQSYSGGAPSGYAGGSSPAPAAFNAAVVAEPPPPPEPVMETITIPDPLADPNYQRVKAQLQRNLAGFNSRDQLARQQYQGTVDDSMRSMGWRGGENGAFDKDARGTAYGTAYENNEGDFSGRGMFYSGELAQSIADMNNDFNDRRGSILRNQRDWTATQDLGRRNFLDDQAAADEEAISDAIAAIAARYSVNTNQVTRGRENQITRERVGP